MENINDNLTQMYLSCLALIVTEHEESIKRIHSFSRQRFLLISISISISTLFKC